MLAKALLLRTAQRKQSPSPAPGWTPDSIAKVGWLPARTWNAPGLEASAASICSIGKFIHLARGKCLLLGERSSTPSIAPGPHPEEAALLARPSRRMAAARSRVWPSFETRASFDKLRSGLLRTRLMDDVDMIRTTETLCQVPAIPLQPMLSPRMSPPAARGS